AVPEVAALDAQYGGPLKGLRDVYRESLAKVDQVARGVGGAPYHGLSTAQKDAVLTMLDQGAFAPDPRRDGRTFMDLLIQHVLEGWFAAREYGGNRGARGWKMVGLEGDDQPLGYSIFDTTTNAYVERPDHPMSTANPDEVVGGVVTPKPLTPDGQHIQDSIVT